MNFNFEHFDKFSNSKWDKIVNSFEGSTFLHSSKMINYFCAFDKNIKNLSFLVKDDEFKYIAAVVLAITNNKKKKSISFSDYICPIPALAKTNKSKRTKLNDFIWRQINNIAKKNKVSKLQFKLYPINNYSIKNKIISSINIFESVKYLPIIDVVNNLILNLKKVTPSSMIIFRNIEKKILKNLLRIM
jgi:hypothetical protein